MPAHVAFLRAVNLGAVRRFGKEELRACVARAGFDDVETHLNTGNVRFRTRMRSRDRIEAALERAFEEDRGFEVPAIVFTVAQVAGIATEGAGLGELYGDVDRHVVLLLKEEPTGDRAAAAEATGSTDHRVLVRGRAAHLLLGPSRRPGDQDPTGVGRVLGAATSRNLTVLDAIARKWA